MNKNILQTKPFSSYIPNECLMAWFNSCSNPDFSLSLLKKAQLDQKGAYDQDVQQPQKCNIQGQANIYIYIYIYGITVINQHAASSSIK